MMMCKSAHLLTALSVASGAEEGISLLQTQAHLHTQKFDLPDPRKQSTNSGEVEIIGNSGSARDWIVTDFRCEGGKGNWVYMNELPVCSGSEDGKEKCDLSDKTSDILAIQPRSDGQIRAYKGKDSSERTYTEHGPVKNEKDCYERARMDWQCNHFMEDMKPIENPWESQAPPILGVWYGGSGWGPGKVDGFTYVPAPNCICARISGHFHQDPAQVSVGDKEKPGMWFCQLSYETDRATQEDLDAAGEPKEKKKKTPEEKEKCAEAKAEAKSSRAALKALRNKLREARATVKDLKAQIKTAKEDFVAKKGARSALC